MSDEPASRDSSKPEKAEGRGVGEWVRTFPALIAAVTALITAVVALRKPPDNTVPKASYEEMSRLIEKLEDSSDQNHQDVVALRNFLEGYLRAQGKAAFIAEAPEPRVRDRQPDRPVRKPKDREGGDKKAESTAARADPAPPAPVGQMGGTGSGAPGIGATGPGTNAVALPKIVPRKEVRRPKTWKDLMQAPSEAAPEKTN